MSLAGKASERGVTLIEMIVVVSLVALLVGITFPAIASGVESLHLRSAADEAAALLNSTLIRAGRDGDAVEITISPKKRRMTAESMQSHTVRELSLPDGVTITGDDDRTFLVYPDGLVPAITIDLTNRKGAHRVVSVDPIGGTVKQDATR